MELGPINLCMVGPNAAKSACKAVVVGTSALHSERLSHDWATTSQHLEIGHAAAAGRGIMGGSGRERTKRSGRSLLEEGAEGTRLLEQSLHLR